METPKPNWTEADVQRTLANPYYCLSNWTTCEDKHEAIISEEEWIDAGAKLIRKMGAKKYLRLLLDNLKTNHVRE
jgi:hypothetical protein